MKKVVSLILAMSLVFALYGCGQSNNNTNANSDITVESSASLPEEGSANVTVSVSTPRPTEKPVEIPLLEMNDVYVEYRGIFEYSSQSWIVNLYIENNRNTEIYVDLDDFLVNGYYVPLRNNNNSITASSKYLAGPSFQYIINTDLLNQYGIKTIESIEFVLKIKEGWVGDSFYEAKVALKMNKTVPINDSISAPIFESTLLDTTDVAVKYCGIYEYSTQSWIINLYVENRRDSEIYIDLNDVKLDGFAYKLSNNNERIPPNCTYLSGACFDLIIKPEDLTQYGITKLKTIDFTLDIKPGWVEKPIYSVPVTLKVA